MLIYRSGVFCCVLVFFCVAFCMAKKSTAKDANKLSLPEGRARFYQQVKARSKWRDPEVPEYYPNWLVRFRVLSKTWVQVAEDYPVAQGLGPVKEWARELIKTQAHLLQTGKTEALRAMREPVRSVSLADLRPVYLGNVPPGKPDYRKNFSRLASMLTEYHGRDEAEIVVDGRFLNRAMVLGWARMRQAHFLRGWSVAGAAPMNAWEVLRADLAAGKLPGLDKSTALPVNTTIATYLRCAKSVFANGREYLLPLVLPELSEFLGVVLKLPVPKGHVMDDETAERVWAGLPALRESRPGVWAFFQVMAWTAARPVQVRGMTEKALVETVEGWALQVPAAKGGNPVLHLIAADVAQALRDISAPGSLIGAGSATAAAKIWRGCNEWLRSFGIEDKHASYLLRHRRGQQWRDLGGVDLARDGMGHTSSKMVLSTYTENRAAIPAVDPSPGARAVG